MNTSVYTMSGIEEAVAESPTKRPRAQWDNAAVALLCHLASEAVHRKLVAVGSLSKPGWRHVWTHFAPRFGKKYNLAQLKTKWRTLSRQYKLWKALLGTTTGIRCDEEMGTLLADDNWWRSWIKVNSDFKTIQYQTIDDYRERVFAPLRDFSNAGRAPADFNSQDDTETLGTNPVAGQSENFGYSQDTVDGGQNSNMHAQTEDMDAGATMPTTDRANAGPSSSRSSGLSRSLFRTPELSGSQKCKSILQKEDEKQMGQIVDYLTKGAKTELEVFGEFVRDPTDLGTVMDVVSKLPGFTYGSEYWLEALEYFQSHDRACPAFLRACKCTEIRVAYLRRALQK